MVGELDIRISGTTCCRRVFGSPFPIDQQVDPEYVKPIHTQGDVEEVTCLECRKVLEAMR